MRALRLSAIALAVAALSACSLGTSPLPAASDTTSSNCVAYPGETVTVYLFESSGADQCVAVGMHQKIEFFNKGFGSTTVGWFGDRRLGSDESFISEVAGERLEPGLHQIVSQPFRSPELLVVASQEPANEELRNLADELSTGGLTRDSAERLLGVSLVLVDHIADPNACWTAVIEGDPYSPILHGLPTDNDSIKQVVITYPKTEMLGDETVCNG